MIPERVKRLRQKSIDAVEYISAERALLITKFYSSSQARGLSAPVFRAKALEYLLRHKGIYIGEDELIVGERGPEPKATSTYPEISVHSLHDLEVLHTREKVSFRVGTEVFEAYEKTVIPYWEGISNRDRIMAAMTRQWHDAYNAGVFTEFQEQRAPGHTVLGKDLFAKGLRQVKEEIGLAVASLDFFADPAAWDKQQELLAMEISCDALLMYARRHAEALERMAGEEQVPQRREELLTMARICRKVPLEAPESLHEMLQHYWFLHLGVIIELNPWDSFNPGRLDQHLYPVYEKDTKEGRLSMEGVYELLGAFWVKFNNHPAPPKIGVTAQESNTYTDFCLINLGGLKPDGSDAVNELSYILLDVIREMRILQPSAMVQVSRKNPDRFIHQALKIIKTGFGQPSCFNADAIIQELIRQGKTVEDARNGGASGCVETGAFGTESYWLTGYFNLTKVLEITLYNGTDPASGKQVGLRTGDVRYFQSFEQLMEAYRRQIKYFIDIKIRGNNVIEKIFARFLPVPFLSLLIRDCIPNARDYNDGGARYNTSYIQGVGLGSVTDNLTALKYQVFEKKNRGMEEVLAALVADFSGYEEMQHAMICQTPKYGNDDKYADQQAVQVFECFFAAVDGRPTARGGVFRINMLPTTSHVYFGRVTGAMPDGRNAGVPLSEGISPTQGMDRQGPTAVIKSASKIDHIRTGGTLLNQKFTPQFFEDEENYDKLTALIRSYFRLGGHHIQFNVVSAGMLREAQKHPEKYRDLIVRVAGYSDYFNDLGEDLQEEIIRRTAQETS